MRFSNSGDGARHRPEVVHAAPEAGQSFTSCCDRTEYELPATDRITRNANRVTCNRLTAADELLLTGQTLPAARTLSAERSTAEQLLFEMAVSVRSLCGSGISLQTAFEKVQTATLEEGLDQRAGQVWSAATMVRITSRAMELAGQ